MRDHSILKTSVILPYFLNMFLYLWKIRNLLSLPQSFITLPFFQNKSIRFVHLQLKLNFTVGKCSITVVCKTSAGKNKNQKKNENRLTTFQAKVLLQDHSITFTLVCVIFYMLNVKFCCGCNQKPFM